MNQRVEWEAGDAVYIYLGLAPPCEFRPRQASSAGLRERSHAELGEPSIARRS